MISRRTLMGAVALAPALGPTRAFAKLFSVTPRPVESFTLANGLEVVVLPSRRAPIVSQTVIYKAGSADEVVGKTGVAHFLEHMMFKGTGAVGAGEFSRTVSSHGGRDNAYTTFDVTGYYQTVSPDRLDLVMRMEADRMADLRITDKELQPERQVVLEERRMRTESSPAALLEEVVQEKLYGRDQPYGVPVIGYVDDINRLGVGDLETFYRQHYAPNNAVLIVAGDATPDEVRALAEKSYAPVPRREVGLRQRPSHGAEDLPQRVARADVRVAEPAWGRTWLAPSYRSGETRHAYALQVLARLLGGNETSRLSRALVEESKVALSAWASYSADSLGLSAFEIGIHPARSASLAEVEEAAGRQLGRLLDDGVKADEVERAQNQLLAAAIYGRDSLATGPRVFASALGTGSTVADVQAWPQRIAAVTAAEVVAAARHVWRPDGLVTAELTGTGGGK
ncbi:MAG: insulinase family protein [Alphaproteobacteria bacterium]|nr:insulinase family protein [Alphaproteobacteria bacterium]